MTYSSANLAASALARHNSDLPILVHSNVARDVLGQAVWSTAPHPMWHPKYLVDDRHHLWSRPLRGAATLYLVFEFAAPGVSFDVAAILGHNLQSVGGTVTASIQIANDTAFSTDLLTIASWSSSLGRRLVSTELGGGTDPGITVGRYSGVEHLRIRIASNGAAPLPRIGEVWLGSRAALRGRPLADDYDEAELEGGAAKWVSESGRVVQVHRYDGRRVLRASWDGLSDDEADVFRDAWDGCRGGRDTVLWIEHPDTDPRSAHAMRADSADFAADEPSGTSTRAVGMALLEEPPYVAAES